MKEDCPDYRHNLICFLLDSIFFGIGMAFASPTTILPSFVSQLTDSPPMIGLVLTIQSGAWLLPQLIAANYLADKAHKKPYLLLPAALGRSVLLLLAAVVFLAGDSSPGLILILFFAAFAIFMGTDALASVAWFDILGRAIPPTRRGRLFGAGQIVLGLTTIGVGALMNAILGASGLPFPRNYALVFLLASLSFSASWLAISFLREPAHQAQTDRLPWRAFLPKLWTVLNEDRAFRQVTIVRLLAGLGGMAIPFYIVYAIDALGMGEEAIGFFLSAQMIGSALAGFIMGYLSERSGSKAVIQLSNALALSSPILALSLPALKLRIGLMPVCIYAFVFAAIGAVNSSLLLGFLNFVLEMAPSEECLTYIGLANAISGLLLLVPLLGGWLLRATSYPVLFAVTAAGVAISLALSSWLVEPRQRGEPSA